MPGSNALPNIHDLRRVAREASYPNSQEEREMIRRTDEAVWDQVREFERYKAADAETFLADNNEYLTESVEITTSLTEEVRTALTNGADPEALAARFESLRLRGEEAIERLEAADRDAAWHQARCADPERYHRELLDKFPVIRRAINLYPK